MSAVRRSGQAASIGDRDDLDQAQASCRYHSRTPQMNAADVGGQLRRMHLMQDRATPPVTEHRRPPAAFARPVGVGHQD